MIRLARQKHFLCFMAKKKGIPSDNQTWQWKIHHLSHEKNVFPLRHPFKGIFQLVMLDY
jgi:hypothetical protein